MEGVDKHQTVENYPRHKAAIVAPHGQTEQCVHMTTIICIFFMQITSVKHP